MVKKILLLVLFFQVLANFAWVRKENDFGPRNLIETGLTTINFFNHRGFEFIPPIKNGYISYTRLVLPQHFFFKVDHQSYAIMYHHSPNMAGSVVATAAHIGRFSLGKAWACKKWWFLPYVSLDYRRGFGDYIQLTRSYYMGTPYAIFPYKSWGTGIGGTINYRIGERFMLGFETHLDYFFQKNLQMDDELRKVAAPDFTYQPNRVTSISHLKIGLLF